ncbi:MAG: ParB/RepB/Spo0J family partition protein [Phycisphaerae bacterium]
MAKTTKKTVALKPAATTKKELTSKKTTKHLGRGLQSLIPAKIQTTEVGKGDKLLEIRVQDITPNPYQPRMEWGQEELAELVDSIKANGIIQPIVVREYKGKYQIIAGERRWRASKIAGNKTIPAIVKIVIEEHMLEMALIENIHRTDLNAIERANAYQDYVTKFKLTQTEVAERLGENRSVVANHIRLLELPSEVKDMLVNNALSMGQARALLALPDQNLQKKLAYRAMTGRLTVREVEKLVKKQLELLSAPEGSEQKQAAQKSAHILDLESRMRETLGTKVLIKTNKTGKKGSITIDFYSLEEFDRLAGIFGIDMTE